MAREVHQNSDKLHLVYSLLHTICHCLQTPVKPLFCKKKMSFAKYDKNTSTHYSSSTAVFAKTENIPYYSEKRTLCLLRDRLLRQMRFVKKFFWETFSNYNESFSTHYSHFARILSIRQFSSLFANKVQRIILYALFAFRLHFIGSSVFVVVHE